MRVVSQVRCHQHRAAWASGIRSGASGGILPRRIERPHEATGGMTLSSWVSTTLPRSVVEAFSGNDLQQKVGLAYLLVTTDPDGTPHPCMLSAGEILAVDDTRIRVALWPATRTAANMARGSRTLLCFVADHSVLYIAGTPRSMPSAGRLERFEIEVTSVNADVHEGMPVNTGIRFDVEGLSLEQLVRMWSEQIDSLRLP